KSTAQLRWKPESDRLLAPGPGFAGTRPYLSSSVEAGNVDAKLAPQRRRDRLGMLQQEQCYGLRQQIAHRNSGAVRKLLQRLIGRRIDGNAFAIPARLRCFIGCGGPRLAHIRVAIHSTRLFIAALIERISSSG